MSEAPLARFDCKTIDEAKAVILEAEKNLSTEERWDLETKWLLDRLVLESGPVLDFGCGVGRLAKEIAGPVTPVLGVDTSAGMRTLAREYVKGNPHFRTASPAELDQEIAEGYRAKTALAVWVLQHSLTPEQDIGRLSYATERGSRLYVVNCRHRAVPAPEGKWVDDGISIGPLLHHGGFHLEYATLMPNTVTWAPAMFQRWRRV